MSQQHPKVQYAIVPCRDYKYLRIADSAWEVLSGLVGDGISYLLLKPLRLHKRLDYGRCALWSWSAHPPVLLPYLDSPSELGVVFVFCCRRDVRKDEVYVFERAQTQCKERRGYARVVASNEIGDGLIILLM